MKKFVMFVALMAALVVVADAAWAKPGGRGRGRGRGHKLPPEVLEKYDTNKDGKLDETERAAMREARHQEMLDEFDADGDGTLNEAEKAKAREARDAKRKERRGARRQAMKDKIDTDGDGAISAAEKEAARKTIRATCLARFDANEDGTLDRGEKRRAFRRMCRTPRGRMLLRGLHRRHRQGGDEAPVTPSE